MAASLETKIEKTEASLREESRQLSLKIDRLDAGVRAEFEKFREEIKQMFSDFQVHLMNIFATKEEVRKKHTETIKWMFLFWASQLGGTITLLFLMFKK